MTELEEFKSLFTRVGIDFDLANGVVSEYGSVSFEEEKTLLIIDTNNDDYVIFYQFDEKGKFVEHGVWE